MTRPRWPDEKLDELRVLVADPAKYSAAQIGEMLHVKRNAVIGACYRNGIKLQGKPSKCAGVKRVFKGRTYKFKFEPVPEVTPEIKLLAADVVPLNLPSPEPHCCNYPYGEGPYFFCGHPVVGESSYCGPHKNLCYVKPKDPVNTWRDRRKAA